MNRVEVFDGVASVACGDMLLMLWQTPARRARICQATRWVDAVVAEHPDTIAVCQLLLSSASPPDSEGRAVARVEALRLAPKIRRAVMVPLGGSLFQNLVRGILRAAVLVAGHGEQIKVASNERDAVDALIQVATPRSAARADLETAIESLYTSLSVEPPTGWRPQLPLSSK